MFTIRSEGLRIVKATGQRAETQAAEHFSAAPPAEDNLAMAYARVARAVRLTLMLQAKVVDEILKLDAAGQARRDEAEAQSAPDYAQKARVERIVERVAKAVHGDDEAEIDRLVCEAGERLDDDDLYRDLLTRPVSELVAGICRDLGLDPDWTSLAQEAWAQDEIASGTFHPPPGSSSRAERPLGAQTWDPAAPPAKLQPEPSFDPGPS